MTAEVAEPDPNRFRIGLDGAALGAICPFHVVWDEQLRTVQVGDVLARIRPGLRADGDVLGKTLQVVQPRELRGYQDLVAAAGVRQPALLEAVDDPQLRLRGDLVAAADGRHVVFIGSLVVTDLADTAALGVTLADFPAHDSVPALLRMARSQANAIAEATELTEQLRRLNRELEDRVDERTRSLSTSRDKLALYALQLEDVSERLRAESHDRARAEEELRVAHRLEAVGQLAAGIAHEINTPVQFVGDNLRFLGDALESLVPVLAAYDDLAATAAAQQALAGTAAAARQAVQEAELDFLLEEAPRAVRESLEGIARVSTVVGAMRDFAHRGTDLRPTDLNQCVRTTLQVTRNEYRDIADVVTDLADDLPPVPCITGEINQVLLTLLVNAAHAIEERVAGGSRGTITVRTRLVEGPDGPEAEIAVADTGGGIDDEVLPRIFDPFFTTKPVGRGTGQGLTTAHAIVTGRHRGRLSVSTTPGTGSEFVVLLPAG